MSKLWLLFLFISVTSSFGQSPYLYVWAGYHGGDESDFLAVIDAKPESPTYGRVLKTVRVKVSGTMPHHTEYEFPTGNVLFANGWAASRIFIFDVGNIAAPKLRETFVSVDGYSYPHSFFHLPNGHVLVTFQGNGKAYRPPGGLVELDSSGTVVRSASAADSKIDDSLIWPYSMAVLPEADRIVISSFVMGGFPEALVLPVASWTSAQIDSTDTKHIQVWSLSSLKLISTIELPQSPDGHHERNPAEPRVLSDGSVAVNTFNCGLYHVHGLKTDHPSAHFIAEFPGGDLAKTPCGIPVVIGNFWIQTVSALPGLIALDMNDPDHPVEVSRLVLDKQFPHPHWVAADRHGNRVVVTGAMEDWVVIINVDRRTGKLALDRNFRTIGGASPGLRFSQLKPFNSSGHKALPHGALFAH